MTATLSHEFADLPARPGATPAGGRHALRQLVPEDSSASAAPYSLRTGEAVTSGALGGGMLHGAIRGRPAGRLRRGLTASLILDDLRRWTMSAPARAARLPRRTRRATAILAARFALKLRVSRSSASDGPAPRRVLASGPGARSGGRRGPQRRHAGQAADLEMTGRPIDFGTLEFIHSRNTGALFIAAAAIRRQSRPNADANVRAAIRATLSPGLAFQIVDDLLDASVT